MKQVHEHADRNKGPIADALDGLLPSKGVILEVASRSGQHVAYFARRFPHLMWQPSDPSPDSRTSIVEHLERSGLSNVRAPLDLDPSRGPWPIARADAIVCVNLLDNSTWDETKGLIARATVLLEEGQTMFLYGARHHNGALERAASPAFRLTQKIDLDRDDHVLVFERCGSTSPSGSTTRK